MGSPHGCLLLRITSRPLIQPRLDPAGSPARRGPLTTIDPWPNHRSGHDRALREWFPATVPAFEEPPDTLLRTVRIETPSSALDGLTENQVQEGTVALVAKPRHRADSRS